MFEKILNLYMHKHSFVTNLDNYSKSREVQKNTKKKILIKVPLFHVLSTTNSIFNVKLKSEERTHLNAFAKSSLEVIFNISFYWCCFLLNFWKKSYEFIALCYCDFNQMNKMSGLLDKIFVFHVSLSYSNCMWCYKRGGYEIRSIIWLSWCVIEWSKSILCYLWRENSD